MLKIASTTREPFWLDASQARTPIEGFRVKVRPITLAMIIAARQSGANAVLARMKELGVNAEGEPRADPAAAVAEIADKSADAKTRGDIGFVLSIAKGGILEWEGVGDADGAPVPVTPEVIEAALEDWRVYDFIDQRYVMPGLVRTDEKNGSSPSQNGTTGAKTLGRGSANTARKRAPSVPMS